MGRNSVRIIVLASACLTASGCVSLFENSGFGGFPMPIYAGVRTSAEAIKEASREPPSLYNGACGLFLIIDMPLSAAMDTVLLPWAIYWAHKFPPVAEQPGENATETVDRDAADADTRQPKVLNKSDHSGVTE